MSTIYWYALGTAILVSFSAGAVIGYLWGKAHRASLEKALDEYKVSEQRRLHDAGRKYPARPDAGAPARVHRAQVRRGRTREWREEDRDKLQ